MWLWARTANDCSNDVITNFEHNLLLTCLLPALENCLSLWLEATHTEAYLTPCETSMMHVFTKIVLS